MAKIFAKKQYKANGKKFINAYQVNLQKVATEEAGFSNGDELDIEYSKNCIKITKK